jgi:hypothetical protein
MYEEEKRPIERRKKEKEEKIQKYSLQARLNSLTSFKGCKYLKQY